MKKLTSAKNFVVSHKTAILVVAVTVLTVAVATQQAGLNQHNDFLKEKNLRDEFYAMNDDE